MHPEEIKSAKLDVLKRIKDYKVIVLGDVMLDVYDFCYSEHSRPSPESPGKKVYHAARSLRTLGGAGNVASNLASLGASTVLISVCGTDPHAYSLRQLADESAVHHFILQDSSRPTSVKTRLYIDDEYLLRRDDEVSDQLGDEMVKACFNEFTRELKGADAVIMSDYNKGFFTPELSRKVIDLCSDREIPVVVDFKPANRTLFSGAYLMAPNRIEAQSISGGFTSVEDLESSCRSLRATLGCRRLAVTLGKHGICGFDGEAFFWVAGNRVRAVDAVGCGDTGKAALALASAANLPFPVALSFANDAAAIVVQKIGTAGVTPEELQSFINSNPLVSEQSESLS